MVRPALFADIPQICALMEEGHQRSKYAKHRLDMKKFKALCMEMIRSGNGCVFVAGENGAVEGFIIGMMDDLYHVLRAHYATDLFFYVADGAPGAVQLLKRFIAWAKVNPSVVTIRLGVTNMIGDYERVGRLYEHLGFVREGAMYEMEVVR